MSPIIALLTLVPLISALPDARIIGGTQAKAGQFPFMAAIYKTTTDGTFFCAGTLITNQFVLTAAQCVQNGITFQIRLGSTTLTTADGNRVIVSTSTYYIHEEYDPNTLNHDIAVLKFHIAISFTDYIKPVDFLGGNALEDTVPVTTVGWGQVSDYVSGLSNELLYVDLSTLSNDECKVLFGEQIADHMVCVAGNYNEGVCNGDSGGPLIIYGVLNRVMQVGISSFMSGNGCETTEPSGFTRIDPYVEWLQNITSNG